MVLSGFGRVGVVLVLFVHFSDVVETGLLQLFHVPLVLADYLGWHHTLEGVIRLEYSVCLLLNSARVDKRHRRLNDEVIGQVSDVLIQ